MVCQIHKSHHKLQQMKNRTKPSLKVLPPDQREKAEGPTVWLLGLNSCHTKLWLSVTFKTVVFTRLLPYIPQLLSYLWILQPSSFTALSVPSTFAQAQPAAFSQVFLPAPSLGCFELKRWQSLWRADVKDVATGSFSPNEAKQNKVRSGNRNGGASLAWGTVELKSTASIILMPSTWVGLPLPPCLATMVRSQGEQNARLEKALMSWVQIYSLGPFPLLGLFFFFVTYLALLRVGITANHTKKVFYAFCPFSFFSHRIILPLWLK